MLPLEFTRNLIRDADRDALRQRKSTAGLSRPKLLSQRAEAETADEVWLLRVEADLGGYQTWSKDAGWRGFVEPRSNEVRSLEGLEGVKTGRRRTGAPAPSTTSPIGTSRPGTSPTGTPATAVVVTDLRLAGVANFGRGFVSPLGFSVVRCIQHLSHLRVLDLSNNCIGGLLSDAVPKYCLHLEALCLTANMLRGPLPQSLGDLVKLRELRLSNNCITGEVDGDLLGRLRKLELLELTRNRLVGEPLPPGLVAGCVSLRDVRLGCNKLDMPLACAQRCGLRRLDLHGNDLYGGLEEGVVDNLRELRHLDLCKNSFCGPVPVSALSLLPLAALMLNHNRFAGARTAGARLQDILGPKCLICVDGD
ncbi:hypothetical protein M885DRAFT_569920 [Pelagophyceae sp. CCMP2097]|nr:hypothetical protein M885DRAFT_569920 [Pelagophyceae sp. CCMP2097]